LVDYVESLLATPGNHRSRNRLASPIAALVTLVLAAQGFGGGIRGGQTTRAERSDVGARLGQAPQVFSASLDGTGTRSLRVEGIGLSRGSRGLIAFLHGRRLAVMRSDGGGVRLLGVANPGSEDPDPPSWSPSGRLVAVGNGHSCELFADCRTWSVSVIDVQTGSRRAVIRWAKEPSWSPDGRMIAFQGGSQMGDPRAKVRYGLYVARLDGHNRRKLARGGLPAWSPSGTFIAFYALSRTGRHIGLHLIRPGGTGVRSLGRTEPVFAWSPNGRNLAYTGPFFFPSSVTVVSIPSGRWHRIGRVGFANPGAVAWSPNGRTIAWVVFDDRHDLSRLVVAPADGTKKPREIAKTAPGERMWTPVFTADGRRVLYSVQHL
jgi:Tol biopolymer transport system component